MRGIVLAGGSGTRLYPLTLAVSKQLLPIYDKPLIYYPIATLMLAGIREILVITTPEDATQFRRLLGDGSHWGIEISYEIQNQPRGIAEALIVGEDFVSGRNVALILGDNIFYGQGMGTALQKMSNRPGATVFAYESKEPQRFGVIEFDSNKNVLSIDEKPHIPKSNFVIPGLYFYDQTVVERAKLLKPSARNELEITDLHRLYLADNLLQVEILDNRQTWFDAGTIEGLLDATLQIKQIEGSHGKKINVPEEIAWRLGLISKEKLKNITDTLPANGYAEYIRSLLSS